jgi:hypothetical protein
LSYNIRDAAAKLSAAYKASGDMSSGAAARFKSDAALNLESQGWEAWLRRLGARTFTGSFSDFHAELWGWYWQITMKRLRGEPLTEDELVFLAIWFRGGGKSSHVEWCCIAEGALLGEGYVMYLCDTETQAQGHVAAIRKRLESSEIAAYYPGLARPEISRHGAQVGWRQDYLATASGWGIIPVGLDQGIRGGRKDDLRFTMIVLDDIDDIKDSLAGVQKKLDIISRSILPAGQADTLVLFPQNLIREDGVLNQIVTRRSDVLSQRIVSGPVPAFEKLELTDHTTEAGLVWEIKSAVPTWPDINMDAARRYLAKSGRAAFLSEYQHDFTSDRSELVFSNWDDEIHVITQDEFASIFGTPEIPDRWYSYPFHDWARTNTQYHANVAGVLSVSSMNEPLPGFVFLHDLMSFEEATEPDDVALRFLKILAPLGTKDGQDWDAVVRSALNRSGLEQFITNATALRDARHSALARVIPPLIQKAIQRRNFVRWRMSHERPDLQKIYSQVYGLPFVGANPGKGGGVELFNHYTRVDRGKLHPFKSGVLGFSRFFMVVPNDKAKYPSALLPDKLRDSDRCRYQFKHYKNAPLKLTEMGVIDRGEVKQNDDFPQGVLMQFYDNRLRPAPLSYDEQLREAAPKIAEIREEAQAHGGGVSPEKEFQYFFEMERARKKVTPAFQEFDDYGSPL